MINLFDIAGAERMDSKINVLGIYIDNYTGKEAMKEAVAFMETDPVSIVEILSVDAVMDVDLETETKEQLKSFDLVIAGEKMILEAADVEEKRCIKETEDRLFVKMFLRFLHKNHKRVYLLVETEEEGEALFHYLEHYYKGIQIVGMAKVSATDRADDMLVNEINGAETDCVLSVLGSPLQEDFAAKNRALMNTRVLLGVGKTTLPWMKQGFDKGTFSRFFTRRIFKKEMEKQKAMLSEATELQKREEI